MPTIRLGSATPSPRLSGERAWVRGFELATTGLLSPALSSFEGGEGENGVSYNVHGNIAVRRVAANEIHFGLLLNAARGLFKRKWKQAAII